MHRRDLSRGSRSTSSKHSEASRVRRPIKCSHSTLAICRLRFLDVGSLTAHADIVSWLIDDKEIFDADDTHI